MNCSGLVMGSSPERSLGRRVSRIEDNNKILFSLLSIFESNDDTVFSNKLINSLGG